MYITHIGADSKPYEVGSFKACLGTCVTTGDISSFNRLYDETIDDILGDQRGDRTVYKSYDLAKIFGPDLLDVLEEFLLSINDSEDFQFVNLFTTFNTQKLPRVNLYSEGGSKSVKTLRFIDILNQYYNYVCTWKVSKIWGLNGCKVLLDNFQGELTKAWTELRYHHDIDVIFEGDKCNRLVSTADLITRYLEEKTKSEHIKLEGDNINDLYGQLGVENGNAFYIGQSDFESIVPTRRYKIKLDEHYVIPTVFVLKEGIIGGERNWIEGSPLYNKLLNFTCSVGGGLKFIDYNQDPHKLRDGDYIIYMGKRGKEQAEYIVDILGYGAKAKSIKEI